MEKILPQLRVYDSPVSIKELAQTQKPEIEGLINFASGFYGEKTMLLGDTLSRAMNTRLMLGEYAPYIRDIQDTVDVFGVRGVRTLQHSVTIGCSTIVRDLENSQGGVSPVIQGTVDWEQVGDNLSSVVSMAVLENPIKPEKPVLSANIACAAFGLVMMNSKVAGKINRAPLPNKKNPDIDFDNISEEEYRAIKVRNSAPYMLSTVANTVFKGRPSCAYLLRHALNLDLNFEDTVNFLTDTKTCDFSIMTIVGTNEREAVTIEKRADQYNLVSAYKGATNHWDAEGAFGALRSLPRTLNSEERAKAIEDVSRPSLFKDGNFVFANDGVVDHTTRIILEMCPAKGEMSLVTVHGGELTSQAVKGRFDGNKLEDIEHFTPDM